MVVKHSGGRGGYEPEDVPTNLRDRVSHRRGRTSDALNRRLGHRGRGLGRSALDLGSWPDYPGLPVGLGVHTSVAIEDGSLRQSAQAEGTQTMR
jgi:hypothetical protein